MRRRKADRTTRPETRQQLREGDGGGERLPKRQGKPKVSKRQRKSNGGGEMRVEAERRGSSEARPPEQQLGNPGTPAETLRRESDRKRVL